MQAKHTEPSKQYRPGWLESMDSRYSLSRELRARFDEVCSDLGGADPLSYMQRSLVERGLWLEYWLAMQEREMAKGQELDVGKWVQAANSLQGIYSRLGLERRSRDVPNLSDYLKAKAAQA